MTVTLLVTEIDKIIEAITEKQFTGGIIKIIDHGDVIIIRDVNDMLVTSWTREVEEQTSGE